MGGRSRQGDRFSAAYSFVADLSDARLESYGRATSAGYQNLDYTSTTQTGVPTNEVVFNAHLAAEYQRRTGEVASWDIAANGIRPNFKGVV